MTTSLSSWVRSVAIAAMVTSAMLAVLIVSAEEVPALKDWLKATFYHHWLGKGALAIAVFIVVSIAARFQGKTDTSQLPAIIFAEAIVVALSVAAISG
ncbi:MAG: hypothetical protein U1D26_00635, partial [Patescibacteria group bacterium]|nr:hypothetical protein [Patescibacteria group bacterium]